MLKITSSYIILHLNLKRLRFTGETRDLMDMSVLCERESRRNIIESFATSCHIQLYQDLKREP